MELSVDTSEVSLKKSLNKIDFQRGWAPLEVYFGDVHLGPPENTPFNPPRAKHQNQTPRKDLCRTVVHTGVLAVENRVVKGVSLF